MTYLLTRNIGSIQYINNVIYKQSNNGRLVLTLRLQKESTEKNMKYEIIFRSLKINNVCLSFHWYLSKSNIQRDISKVQDNFGIKRKYYTKPLAY